MKRFQVSKIQKQFWILNGMNPESGSYNLFSAFRLSRPLDPGKLEEAVKYVIDRHEPLRTSFDFVDNELYQIIRTASETDFSVNTISIDQPFDQAHLHPSVIREANKPFDLSKAPLCRVSLFAFADNVMVLTIVMHHIIVDVRSEGVFAREMSARYNYLEGIEQNLPPDVPYQYSDYINEINDWYETEDFMTKLELMAAGCPDPNTRIQLPEDPAEAKPDEEHGSEVFFSINEELTEKVKTFSERNNINPYRFFLTAYSVFLSRLSGQEKFYIGLPLTNRTRAVSKTTFGCFINALPLSVDFTDGKDLAGIMNSVRETLSEMLGRQEVPFTDLVSYTRDENTTTVNPYFQTGYAFKPPMQLELDGIEAQILKVEKTYHQTEFDLLLTFYPEENTFTGYITYSRQLFKRVTIEKWIEIFKRIVIQLIENPDLSVGNVDILTDDDKATLKEFNNTSFPVSGMLIHELVEKQAGLTPDKTAVISGDTQLTYRELDEQATQMANYLIEKGVRTGDSVGVCLERSAEMIVSVLGVLKAGCTYIPMDPSFPDDRIKYMFEDSGASMLITQGRLADRFRGFENASTILTDNDKPEISAKSTKKPSIKADQLSIAYMIYTSGSTGKPKGVEVYHRGVVNLVESMSKVPGISEKDILLAVVTLSFDMSVYEIYLPLSNGATVVIASSSDTTDGQALMKLIERHDVTMLQATPSLWNILLGSGWKGKKDLRAFCGGEALTKNLVRQALPRVEEFWNCYGPTETTVYSACMRVTDPEAPIIIGKPIGNTRIYILDKFNNNLPVGMTGEVCIGGLGVTKGYCNLPELTKEKFIYLGDEEIVYKTGDLGRFLPDGNIELFGRIDNQIKLRGFRIEPGEIENLLSRLDGIREAVVKIHKFEETDDRLVAFLNTEPDFKLSNENINNFLSQHLPAYMIPSFYQVSNEFPRLPNGKINKKALVFNVEETRKDEVVQFENLSPTQKKMYSIWSDILRIGNINPSSNFFDIGGNSLLAIRILNKIKEDTGFVLSFKDFMSNPTIMLSGNFIESKTAPVEKRIELKHITSNTNLPLTANQRRIWLITKLQPDIPSYVIPFSSRLRGNLDVDIFKKSVQLLFNRHKIVFSVIKENDGEPFCELDISDVNISMIDYSDLQEEVISEKVRELINSDSRKKFILDEGPLYRLYLIKTGQEEYIFHLSIHHIIFDGWSWSVFAKDLSLIYNSLKSGNAVTIGDLEYQQYDFAQWENYYSGTGQETESARFWRENLKGCSSTLNFPYDYQRSDVSTGKGLCRTFKFSKEVTDKIREISKNENVSLFVTLLAAYGVQMHAYSGDDDLNIGLPIVYRPDFRLEDIFGMFVNTVVVRLQYEKGLTFRDALGMTNDSALNAIAHQDLSFDKVVEIINPERTSNANPLFQVGFIWQNNLDVSLQLDGVQSEKISGDERTSIFDITLSLWENGDNMEGELECNSDLIKKDTLDRLIDNYKHLVHELIFNPDRSLSDISVLSDNDKKLIDTFNSTAMSVPDLRIHELFESIADQFSENKAVTSGSTILSYGDLNRCANQIAGQLIKNGVKTGDIVGLCLERSHEMIISALGILKAGCTYLPMDPSFPDERIKYMFEDSGSGVLITQVSLMDKFSGLDNTRIVLVDKDADEIAKNSTENPCIKVNSDNLAYIIYTSGSTGKPKGVKVHHGSVVNFLCSMKNKPGFSADDRILAVTTLSFDISVLEIFLPLSTGGEIVVATAADISEGETLSELLEKNDITVMQATPATWNILLGSGWRGKKNLKALCGGEAILPGLVKELLPKVSSLWNMYGPTETTVWSTCKELTDFTPPILVGRPIDNTEIFILDKDNKQLPLGVTGEVCIGGSGVTKGYNNRDELTSEKFIEWKNGKTIYKTGDLGRYLPDGDIELFGRIDNQIKLRGFRIEPGEIENILSRLEGVREVVVKVQNFGDSDDRLIAFLNVEQKISSTTEEIKNWLSEYLPAYMIPSYIVMLDSFPRLPNGKINKKALHFIIGEKEAGNENDIENLPDVYSGLLNIWKKTLKISSVGINTNFFEAGGTSVLIPRIVAAINKEFGTSLKSVNIFEYPTVRALAEYITSKDTAKVRGEHKKEKKDSSQVGRDIAIIGIAGCFPGADNIDRLWDIIRNGDVSVSSFTREELKNKGVPEELLNHRDYVYSNYMTDRADLFDSAFFEISPREADFMDPQHRLFLETCYEAMENAGYAPRNESMNVGVFAGAGMNTYLIKSLMRHPDALRSIGEFQTMINNDKDFIATRVSYKLNFTGPSLDVQTACSTSMVATFLACQSLLNHDCDMAISGGASVQLPRGSGYLYKKGGILSPTGYCRPFDDNADGTVVGEGAGAILLKRLDDAIRDKDTIYAVIKSVAINNDGALKVGYMAPSMEGQTRVIKQAQEQADIAPESISYVETHGTGTKLGDPIELSALKKAFAGSSSLKNYCALGGVKANIGHLDAASGIAGIIKAILVLRNRQIPPLANFTTLNQELEMDDSPFYINTELKEWTKGETPRRAAVSSFGIGGTNAHCILEEWVPSEKERKSEKRFHLLPLSATNKVSLDKLTDKYNSFFEQTNLDLSDIAYTMQKGRESFRFRHIIITDDLKDRSHYITGEGTSLFENARTAFLFTGQGSQYFSMSKGLYDQFTTFRKYINYADDILRRTSDINLKDLLYDSDSSVNINDTSLAQPALVAVQYATVKLLEEFGIRPDILIGHSIGELTAACVSGVFSYEDALVLAAGRGKIMFEQEKGSMLSVNLPAEKVREILIPGTEVSLINAPEYCVVSGDEEAITRFRDKVGEKYPGVQTVVLKTSHAFHSKSMEPAVKPFRAMVEKTMRKDVNIPFISNTTGLLITNDEARSASYWSGHIRETVNFAKGARTLLESHSVCLEIGPGSTLTSLMSQFKAGDMYKAIPTIKGAKQEADDVKYFLEALVHFWIAGGKIRWDDMYTESQRRVPIPSYAFNRKRHWIETKSLFNYDYANDGETEEKYEADFDEEPISENFDRSGFNEEYVEARSEIQKNLLKIWENFLGVKNIGIIDDFFTLGGHSLLASQVINLVNETYKTDLPIDTLFRSPTVEKLEKILEQAGKTVSPHINFNKTDINGNLPVSNEQKRLWAISRIYNNPSYNLPFTYKFIGRFNEEIFIKSLEEVFKRHAVLRGRFAGNGADPALIIDENQKINIRKFDLTEYDSAEREKLIEQIIGDDTRKVFDLENDPLYRIYLIRISAEEVLFHMTIHHVIFDGWSWGILIRDLKRAYSGLLNDNSYRLSGEVNQYFEYAGWQQSNKNGTLNGKSVTYWKEKLNGYNGMLNFPYDFPRKESRSGYGQKEHFVISPEIKSGLKNVARNLNVTDFTIYISAFSVLLNKYSNDNDICIGIPSANRSSYQLEEIIGFFVNTLVLRFKIKDSLSFADFALDARKVIVEAIEHQDLPFEKLVDVLQPQRSINSNPIFQVLFAWLNTPSEIFEFPDVNVERQTIKRCVAPLDIAIYLWEENDTIEGEIEYSSDILTADTIGLFIENYIHLLSEIAHNSQQVIGSLDVLSPADLDLQKKINRTESDIPPLLLHQLFEENVDKYADKKAIIFKDGFLTYSELNRKADQLASYLIRSGLRPGDVTGISLERSSSMLISVLAVLKAGATYLPLDPLFPADRNRFMLSDSAAGMVITQEIFKDRFSESSARIICIDSISDELEQEGENAVSVSVDGNSVAYMIYTSGSTGLPKGVKVHHRAAVNFVNSMASEPGFTSEDNLLAVTTLSFDISVLELFLPLYCGGSIVMAQTNDIAVGESLIWLINNFNVTVLQATPATWYILLKSGWTGKKNLKALCGGEAISPGLVKRLLPKVSELWNMYGPTETTVWSTCYRITDPDAPVLIGRPIFNTTVTMLSENNHIQPVGVPGELCIGGAGVSKGYHNREELTNEKFIKGPDGQLVYRTGDIGRFRPDGNIELYGRVDNQIKVRGFRIEPGEIESQLCKIAGVEKAVVKVFKFSEIDERMGAFIIVNNSYSETKDSMINKLRIHLPEYMIPRGFKIVKEYPLTPNGKIDRKLLTMDISDFSTAEEKSSEKTVASDVERKILDIWKSELNMPGIGVNDNFFDIGGNSILLIQISDRINKLLNTKIDVLQYFQYPTIRSFYSFLTKGNELDDTGPENKQMDPRARQIMMRRRRIK